MLAEADVDGLIILIAATLVMVGIAIALIIRARRMP